MEDSSSEDLMDEVLAAHKRSYQRAFEVAVKTGTALIFERNGELVEVRPPYRYKLVKIHEDEEVESNGQAD